MVILRYGAPRENNILGTGSGQVEAENDMEKWFFKMIHLIA
jgi:hypothetical protein